VSTSDLIQQLAATATPVHRLAPPWQRAALWFAISLPYVGAITLFHPMNFELAQISDARFVVEELAALTTAIMAAIAAFWSIIPGYRRGLILLPLVPLAIWLAVLGEGCAQDWLRLGDTGLTLHSDWACLPIAVVIGIVPAIVMVAMLRRGAPLVPHTTLALAAVAVAALGNFAMRLFHVGDVSLLLLVWHFGTVVLLAFLASLLGGRILNWQHVKAA